MQAIIADLEAAGYLSRPFRQLAQDGHQIGPLLKLLSADRPGDAAMS